VNRALIWKECREQGLIVAALVVLGGGLLVAAGLLLPAPMSSGDDLRLTMEPRRLAVVLLVLASGVVVGGTLFAGEREQGTFPYLEVLPVARWRIWLGKVLAGLLLVVVAAGLLFAVAAGVGVIGPSERLPFWALIAMTLAFAAFGAGALGSSFAKTSLAACGLGLLSAMALSFIIYPVCALAVMAFGRLTAAGGNSDGSPHQIEYTFFATLFGQLVVPLLLSGWIYTAPDRNRFARDVRTAKGGPVDPLPRRRPRFALSPLRGLRAALWVVARQNLLLTLVLGAVTLASGLSLLQPTLPVLFVWPVATLMLGTVVGVTGWSDEQNSGSFRFWAERRMPVGRLWLAKVGYGLALVALLLVLLALPSFVAARVAGGGPIVPTMFRARLFLDQSFPIAEYLWLWPIYGFAFGHLAGLLFRKAAVGTAVGVMTGGAVAVFWLPSLLAGGVHWYQLWVPPLLALATARALVWSWALDQLGQRRALLRLAGGSGAIALAMTGGLLYRMLEIPEVTESGADLTFRATIPPFDTNDAGREIRRGAVLYAEVKLHQRDTVPEEPLWYEGPTQLGNPVGGKTPTTYLNQLDDVLHLGWPADRPGADAWLDAAMSNGWADLLANASRMPLGTVEDATELNIGSPMKHLDALQGCETMLLARGLQLQARGRPEAFVESVATCLSLVRNLRNKSLARCQYVSWRVEQRTHLGIQRWLEKLGDRPDLLKVMLGLLTAHDATCPRFFADGHLPEQVLMRNSVNAPTQFVKQYLKERPLRSQEASEDLEEVENETELVSFAWAVPWEKERLRRLVGLGNGRAYTRADLGYFRGLPGLDEYAYSTLREAQASARHLELERGEQTGRRASMLLLALRLHRAEKGALPAKLEALVPAYLPAVPADPYDERPFRYRLSKGEAIQMETRSPTAALKPEAVGGLIGAVGYVIQIQQGGGGYVTYRPMAVVAPPSNPVVVALPSDPLAAQSGFRMLDLAAGRGILWSVGPDKIDDGGRRLAVPTGTPTPSGDSIFVVPEPAETKR